MPDSNEEKRYRLRSVPSGRRRVVPAAGALPDDDAAALDAGSVPGLVPVGPASKLSEAEAPEPAAAEPAPEPREPRKPWTEARAVPSPELSPALARGASSPQAALGLTANRTGAVAPGEEAADEEQAEAQLLGLAKELGLDLEQMGDGSSLRNDFDDWANRYNRIVERGAPAISYYIYLTDPEFIGGERVGGHLNTVTHPISMRWLAEKYRIPGVYKVELHGPRSGRANVLLKKFPGIRLGLRPDDSPMVGPVTRPEAPESSPTARPDADWRRSTARPARDAGLALRSEPDADPDSEDDSTAAPRRFFRRPVRSAELRPYAQPATTPPDDAFRDRMARDHYEMLSREFNQRGQPMTPPAGTVEPPKSATDQVLANSLVELVKALTQRGPDAPTPVAAPGPDPEATRQAQAETLRLHEQLNAAREHHRAEIAELRVAQEKALAERARELREGYDRELKALRDATDQQLRDQRQQATEQLNSSLDRLREQATAERTRLSDELATARKLHEQEIERLRGSAKDQADRLAERVADLRDELAQTRSELNTVRAERDTARGDTVLAKSQLNALESTKTAELALVQIKAQVEATKTQPAANPDANKSPLQTLLDQVVQAKRVASELGSHLGPAETVSKEEKPSRLDTALVIGSKVVSDPNVRKLASDMAAGVSRGLASLVQGTATPATSPAPPTLPADADELLSRYRQNSSRFVYPSGRTSRIPGLMRRPAPAPLPAAATAEPLVIEAELDDSALPPEPHASAETAAGGASGASADSSASAGPDADAVPSAADLPLDSVSPELRGLGLDLKELLEDHEALGTAPEVVAEELVERLRPVLGLPRPELLAQLRTTTQPELVGLLSLVGVDVKQFSPAEQQYLELVLDQARKLT